MYKNSPKNEPNLQNTKGINQTNRPCSSLLVLQNTPVILMDESDNALDFLNRHQMMDRFRGLTHSEGKAALVTLHDPNLALNYCDRVILIHE